MNMNGITTKLASNADKLGALLGLVAGSPSGLNDISDSIRQLSLGTVHPPDPNKIAEWLSSNYFAESIGGFIAGVAIEEFAPGNFSKYGKALQKGALGFGAASFGIYLLFSMTHANLGSDPNAAYAAAHPLIQGTSRTSTPTALGGLEPY